MYISGSASPQMALQFDQLAESFPLPMLTLGPDILAANSGELAGSLGIESLRGDDGIIVRISDAPAGASKISSEKICQGLAEAISQAILVRRPGGFFLSGGDTAQAVLDRLGAEALELVGQPLPGLVHVIVKGGAAHQSTVITKAGAFGDPDTLCKLHRLINLKKTYG